jgi:hypothetical protein
MLQIGDHFFLHVNSVYINLWYIMPNSESSRIEAMDQISIKTPNTKPDQTFTYSHREGGRGGELERR